jgi:hypothetical protein
MERQTTILDVMASNTGKWIVIFTSIFITIGLLVYYLSKPKVSDIATKMILKDSNNDKSE